MREQQQAPLSSFLIFSVRYFQVCRLCRNPDAIWRFETGSPAQMSSTDRVWHCIISCLRKFSFHKKSYQISTYQELLDNIHGSRRAMCWAYTGNRREPCSDVDLSHCSFISSHKLGCVSGHRLSDNNIQTQWEASGSGGWHEGGTGHGTDAKNSITWTSLCAVHFISSKVKVWR